MARINKVFQSLGTAASMVAQEAAAENVARRADFFSIKESPAHRLGRVVSGGAIAQSAEQEGEREVDPCQEGENFNIFKCIFESIVEFFRSDSSVTNERPCNFGNRMCIN